MTASFIVDLSAALTRGATWGAAMLWVGWMVVLGQLDVVLGDRCR
jgi:hypothetical protein